MHALVKKFWELSGDTVRLQKLSDADIKSLTALSEVAFKSSFGEAKPEVALELLEHGADWRPS